MNNNKDAAVLERLAILSEELGEVQQVVGKILRHGFDSKWPPDSDKNNRDLLELELGDVFNIVQMMCDANDISMDKIIDRKNYKREYIKQWVYFQD